MKKNFCDYLNTPLRNHCCLGGRNAANALTLIEKGAHRMDMTLVQSIRQKP